MNYIRNVSTTSKILRYNNSYLRIHDCLHRRRILSCRSSNMDLAIMSYSPFSPELIVRIDSMLSRSMMTWHCLLPRLFRQTNKNLACDHPVLKRCSYFIADANQFYWPTHYVTVPVGLRLPFPCSLQFSSGIHYTSGICTLSFRFSVHYLAAAS